MKSIDPGRMRQPIEVQKCAVQADAVGNQTAAWSTAVKAMASVNRLYGQEYWAAAAQGQQNTLTFVMRWCPALGEALQSGDLTRWRVLLEGQAYTVQSVDDLECLHRLVKIRAVMQ